MTADADIAIVGAGCAGLSLAVALAVAETGGRVLLLEPRREYTRDRTWCFWNTEPHPFEAAVSHSWSRWRVSDGTASATRGGRYRYCHLPADAFYEAALARLAREPRVRLCRGVRVHSLRPAAGGRVCVETDRGGVTAGRVFDSRAPLGAPAPVFVQSFLGWHVRTDRACFDPETVELMQFLPSSVPGRIRFVYVLPFARDEALVEMTYLDDPALPEPACEAELEAWLRAHAGGWEVLYTGAGTPGGAGGRGGGPPAPPPTLPGVTRIGIAGGRLKPSSGYGFLRIQRHSRAIAQAVRASRPAPVAAERALYGRLDRIFLRALQAEPAQGPELFLRMFAGAGPDALVRFLSERSTGLAEIARVAWSLPKLPMLRAAFSTQGPA